MIFSEVEIKHDGMRIEAFGKIHGRTPIVEGLIHNNLLITGESFYAISRNNEFRDKLVKKLIRIAGIKGVNDISRVSIGRG